MFLVSFVVDIRVAGVATERSEIMQQHPSDQFAVGRHAIVLGVPWSAPAVASVRAAKSQEAYLSALGAQLTILNEDDPAVRRWLVELGVRDSVDFAIGAGSSLWFSEGHLLRFILAASDAAGMAAIADALWRDAA